MKWFRRKSSALDNSDDIAEARALREEARAKRQALANVPEQAGIISAIVRRRSLDGFGEELQITFTRRTDT